MQFLQLVVNKSTKMKFIILLAAIAVAVQASALPQAKLVGGTDAAAGEYPYVASIRNKGKHECSASIMNKNWVLTSASCVYGISAAQVKVVVGSHLLDEGGVTHDVTKVKALPFWNPAKHLNDVGFLRVSPPIEFNDKVQAISLDFGVFDEEREAVVTGWGQTVQGGALSNNLKYLKGRTMEVFECKKAYILDWIDIYDSHLCMQGVRGEGACIYDSGTPLVSNNKQIGILNFGKGCAQGKPDVYARISSFADYIIAIVNDIEG